MKNIIRARNKVAKPKHLSTNESLAAASKKVAAGEYRNALLILEKAARVAPCNPAVRHLLGESQANTGSFTEAISNLNKAVEADPHNATYRASLAQALMPLKPSEAVPHFLTAILLGSTSLLVFRSLTAILLDLRREEEALKVCDLGLAACPDKFAVLGYRAVVLQRLGRPDESFECSRQQEKMRPGDSQVWCNMGVTLLALGRVAESEQALRQACLFDPQNAEAHYNLALVLLLRGHYREGFREYEWRWRIPLTESQRQHFVQPLWDGNPLSGKRIFLHAEQGVGDVIQFVRYLPLVAKLGGHITLAVPEPLLRLMNWLPHRYEVTPPGLPPAGFDAHCPLMSLPLICGTEIDSIPPPASFVIPQGAHNAWAQRVAGDKPKIALVWAGGPGHLNDRQRSIPLRSLFPLIAPNDADFFSLQVGPPAHQLKSEGLTHRIRDLAPFLTDFAETGAALSCMDLVISADTAVAHLAGTLGRQVWTLLPFAPDWRWLTSREDSPWYPGMHLFRQKTRGDWQTVVDEIVRALVAWLPTAGHRQEKSKP